MLWGCSIEKLAFENSSFVTAKPESLALQIQRPEQENAKNIKTLNPTP